MLHKACDLWAATRLIEHPWKLCGKETFGIDPYKDRADPWVGFVPVTPMMDQQLDYIVLEHILNPGRKELLDLLENKIFNDGERKESLFEIYLAIFVLIHNAEMEIASEREFAQQYGLSGRFGPLGKYKFIEGHFHAARTLLGYFHHICRGNLLVNLPTGNLAILRITENELKYLQYIKKQAKLQGRGNPRIQLIPLSL
jgi:hypothetical protein